MKSLEPIHDRAIDLLLAGHRQYEIAAELKISDRTLRRWIKNEAFREELETQRDGARTMAQTVMAICATESAAFVKNALNAAFAMLNSHDEKTHERAIKLGLKMQAQQERLTSQETWREFVYFDKLKRKEAALKQASESGQDRTEADTVAEPTTETVQPKADTVAEPTLESGQNRTKADTPAEPTAETGQERTKPDTATESTPESGQNRTIPDTTEPPIVIKEAKHTTAPKKPTFKAPNKAPFYARVAGRR